MTPGDRSTDPLTSLWQWPDRRPWGRPALFLLTAASYALGSGLALLLIEESGLSSVFFIPAGVTVAFLISLPRRSWWVVLLAAGATELTMDVLAGYDPVSIVGFTAGNTVEPLIGAEIVRRQCRALDLARIRHVWWFFVGPVLTATAVGAAVGSAPAALFAGDAFDPRFWQWWLGDALGVLLVGGAILVWRASPDRRPLASMSGVGLVAGTVLLTVGVLGVSRLPLRFLVLIGVVVAGAVFGTRAVVVTASIVAMAVAVDLAFGPGSLIIGLPESTALMVIKLQLAVYALAGLVVAAEAQERERATARAAEARALVALTEQERTIERDIALRLQEALLPDRPTQHARVEISARYEAGGASLMVGGDWYDVFTLSGDRIGLTVGDVVGHGLEASAAMSRLRTAVAVLAQLTDSPARVLSHLDDYARGSDGTDFATAGYSILDPATGVLTLASAGHPPMLLVTPRGETRWLTEGLSPPLCGLDIDLRHEASVQLEPGSLLVAYSDGLIERRGEDLGAGLDRLEAEARALVGVPTEKVCDRLLDALGVADQRDDDVVIVALRYEPAAQSEPADVRPSGRVGTRR